MKHSAFKIILIGLSTISLLSPVAYAQKDTSTTDITDSAFTLVVCDGPNIPSGNKDVDVYDSQGHKRGTRPYVVCDFNAAMHEVQHLINIMIVIGVVAAIAGFSYAGFLYIVHGSESGKRSEASSVFKKVFIGFIIMLTAWFIVYQILSWLQCGPQSKNCNSAGSALLEKP